MNYQDLLIVIAENTQTVEDSYTITTAVDQHIKSLNAAKPIVSGSLPLDEEDEWMYCPNCGRVKIQD